MVLLSSSRRTVMRSLFGLSVGLPVRGDNLLHPLSFVCHKYYILLSAISQALFEKFFITTRKRFCRGLGHVAPTSANLAELHCLPIVLRLPCLPLYPLSPAKGQGFVYLLPSCPLVLPRKEKAVFAGKYKVNASRAALQAVL